MNDKNKPPNDEHTISVVIPFYNAQATLERCLNALARQTQHADAYILIDNQSTDDSKHLVEVFIEKHAALPFILLSEAQPGAAAARNTGVAQAKTEWILFTDADCIPKPDWIASIAQAIPDDPKIAGLAGNIRPAPSDNLVASFLGLFTLPAVKGSREFTEYTLIDGGFPTANLAIRREVFNQLNGFDRSIPIYGEDHDLCARLYHAGFSIRTVPQAAIQHIHRHELKSFLRQAFSFGRSHALMLSRHQNGAFICTAPALRMARFNTSHRIWLDLNQADKKLLFILLLGLLWPFFWLLIPLYFIYLSYSIQQRIQKRNMDIPESHALAFAFLLVLKSATITVGRIKGSWQYHVVCI